MRVGRCELRRCEPCQSLFTDRVVGRVFQYSAQAYGFGLSAPAAGGGGGTPAASLLLQPSADLYTAAASQLGYRSQFVAPPPPLPPSQQPPQQSTIIVSSSLLSNASMKPLASPQSQYSEYRGVLAASPSMASLEFSVASEHILHCA